ncbi:MAG: tRNA 4-thiouridine(8) synthase ThiI [Planctomycetes bacterium]|nr:tRNA 4-thiouridine(8) synthase ThiI [Planctomycetota bacterium]
MPNVLILIHYAEVALKGRNRRQFEERLLENIRHALAGLPVRGIRRIFGRLVADLKDVDAWEETAARLERVFGIAHFERAVAAPPDIDRIAETLLAALEGREAASFAIVPRRVDKRFPMTSIEIGRAIGARVQEAKGWKVDLGRPELAIQIVVLAKEAYITFEKRQGPGGLPLGTAGRVGVLLSGGIDSPVAAWRLMRRGCEPVFIHFHSHPFTDAASQEKCIEIARILCRHQRPARLYLVPLAPAQRRIVTDAPSPLRVLLYRRFMVRIAARIARDERALALVTGESLGQVASQTLSNLRAIEAAVDLPILRPLIGCDKLEIIETARRIGTYELSIQAHQDCCSFLMPRSPATRSDPAQLDLAESALDVEGLVAEARDAAEIRET